MLGFCFICEEEIKENTRYSEKKNGDLICAECVNLVVDLVITLLDNDDIVEILKKYR
jgi:hypothetical protein